MPTDGGRLPLARSLARQGSVEALGAVSAEEPAQKRLLAGLVLICLRACAPLVLRDPTQNLVSVLAASGPSGLLADLAGGLMAHGLRIYPQGYYRAYASATGS